MPIWFNYVDALLALVILMSMAGGWRRGFLLGILGLGVLVASLLLAFWSYRVPARLLEQQALLTGAWALPVAFLSTWVVLRGLLGLLADRLLAAVPPRAHGNPVNRLLGLLPGFANGLLYAMVVAVLLLALPWSEGLTAQTRDSGLSARLAGPADWLESRLTPIFEEAVSRTMNRMVVKPGSQESVPLAFTVQNPRPRPDLEAGMLQLINEARAAERLPPLRSDPELAAVARAHSRDMFARGYFSHITPEGKDPFERIREAKLKHLIAGENLALAPTLPLAHQGLMNSPGHRANILRPAFGRVGIGIVDGGKRGQMVTQNFRN